MNTAGERVGVLTGLTVDDELAESVLSLYGIGAYDIEFTEQGILRAAADLLTRTAITAAAAPQLRQTEDVSVEPVKAAPLLALAADLRARADRLDDDAADVMGVIEFYPWGVP